MSTPISAIGLQALLPILVLSATIVLVMLMIAVRRHHKLVAWTTALGSLAALASLAAVQSLLPQQVTPLILMDSYSSFFMALMLAAAFAGTQLFYGYIDRFEGNREEIYLLLLLATLGACVLVASSDWASFFIGLELLSISLFAMIGYPVREKRALEAAIKYLILSAVASAFLLFGIALLYAEIGTLALSEIKQLLPPPNVPYNVMQLAGGAMIMVGIGFKLSLVPFHQWTPDVYEGAPAPVTGYLATVAKGAVLAVALRYFVESGAYRYQELVTGMSIAALLSILIGNWLALMQDNIKRIMAYSSIAHFGYALVAMIAAGPLGVEAVAIYLVTYFVTTLGAFGVIGMMSTPISDRDADALWDYRGLFWRRPYLTMSFTVVLLSLAGIPLTAGFIGKFYIIAAGVEAGLWLLISAVVVGSAIALYYYLRVMVTLYLPSTTTRNQRVTLSRPQWVMGWAMIGLAATVLFMGIYPSPLIAITRAMVATLR